MKFSSGYAPYNMCYDPFSTTMLVLAAIAGGVGTAAATGAFSGDKNSSSNLPALPQLPSQQAASDTAKATQSRQRQMLLASGGQTDFTGGSGNLLGGDVGKATLLGG